MKGMCAGLLGGLNAIGRYEYGLFYFGRVLSIAVRSIVLQ